MSSSQDFTCLRRHETYFIPSGDLNFLVERVSFRVHRFFFERESLYFRDKLAGTASPGYLPNGESDGTAIIMDDVKSADFARFLWVFYNPKYSIYNATWDDWVAILGLAHKWDFPSVKELCVRELEQLDALPVERVHVYHAHDLDRNLLVPRYAEICSREEPISLEEGMKLGLETSLMIARARESARSNSGDGGRSPLPSHVKEQDMITMVKEMFNIPNSPSSRPQSPSLRSNLSGAGTPPPSSAPRPANGHTPQKSSVGGSTGTSAYSTANSNAANPGTTRAGSVSGQNGSSNGGTNYGNGYTGSTNGSSGPPRSNSSGGNFSSLTGVLAGATNSTDDEQVKPSEESKTTPTLGRGARGPGSNRGSR